MIGRLLSWTRRLSWLERFVVVWLVLAPIALVVVIVLGTITDTPDAAAIVLLVYVVVFLLTAPLAVVLRVRKQQKVAAIPVVQVTAPPELAKRGIIADDPAAWAALDSPQAERLRVVRRAATERSRSALLNTGLQTRSAWAREPLAYLASHGRFDYATLERLVVASAGGDGGSTLLLRDVDLDLLLSLSRLVSSQSLSEADPVFFRAALDYAIEHRGSRRISYGNQVYLTERVIMSGQLERGAELVARLDAHGLAERLLAADACNPFRSDDPGKPESVWLAGFNSIYLPYGLEPVSLAESGESPYDRLRSTATSSVPRGPLITVIMSCFQPDHGLRTAVQSMIAQSWTNWELLIMDDGSPEGYEQVLAEAEAMDPRVRVIRSATNGGTYARRNDGILEARGEFVTMHDSDDWVHPRRLELQARHLIADPGLPANLCYSLRVSEDLMFVQARGSMLRLTESSLLFRKDLVVSRVGYFDGVRKAADTEFRLRIEAAFDTEIPVIDTLSPLALVRYTASSLSGSDLSDGWMHPARLAYRNASTHFHDRIRAGLADPRLPYPLVERRFVVHDHLLGRVRPPQELDILYVLDGREQTHTEGGMSRLLRELEAGLASGLAFGILHLPVLSEARAQEALHPELQSLVSSGRLVQILPTDVASAATVVVRGASVLQTAPSTPSRLQGGRVLVVEDRAPGGDRRGSTFARADVIAAAERVFGVEPEWTTSDRFEIASLLSSAVPRSSVESAGVSGT